MARGGPHSSINLQFCIYLLDPKLKKTTGAHYSKVHIGSRAFTTYFQSVSSLSGFPSVRLQYNNVL